MLDVMYFIDIEVLAEAAAAEEKCVLWQRAEAHSFDSLLPRFKHVIIGMRINGSSDVYIFEPNAHNTHGMNGVH